MIDEKRWQRFSFYQQMGNIASEISRAIHFEKKEELKHLDASLLRLHELIVLTIDDKKNKFRLKELCRLKEVTADWLCRTDMYTINPESLKRYSLQFAALAVKENR